MIKLGIILVVVLVAFQWQADAVTPPRRRTTTSRPPYRATSTPSPSTTVPTPPSTSKLRQKCFENETKKLKPRFARCLPYQLREFVRVKCVASLNATCGNYWKGLYLAVSTDLALEGFLFLGNLVVVLECVNGDIFPEACVPHSEISFEILLGFLGFSVPDIILQAPTARDRPEIGKIEEGGRQVTGDHKSPTVERAPNHNRRRPDVRLSTTSTSRPETTTTNRRHPPHGKSEDEDEEPYDDEHWRPHHRHITTTTSKPQGTTPQRRLPIDRKSDEEKERPYDEDGDGIPISLPRGIIPFKIEK